MIKNLPKKCKVVVIGDGVVENTSLIVTGK